MDLSRAGPPGGRGGFRDLAADCPRIHARFDRTLAQLTRATGGFPRPAWWSLALDGPRDSKVSPAGAADLRLRRPLFLVAGGDPPAEGGRRGFCGWRHGRKPCYDFYFL